MRYPGCEITIVPVDPGVTRRVLVALERACYLHVLPRPFVRPSACISAATTGQISVKFGIVDFYENLWQNPNLVRICQEKYRTLYMKT